MGTVLADRDKTGSLWLIYAQKVKDARAVINDTRVSECQVIRATE
jgi:hypothetical protein